MTTSASPTPLLPATAAADSPNRVATFLDLIKFAHTVFALPFALVAAFMAAHALGRRWPDGVSLALVLLCMVAARTFAMTVNRLVDRKFDRLNPRTARRPSVTGAVSPAFMVTVIALTAALFIAGALGFYWRAANPWPALLAGPVLVWLAAYSFTKRFTALCHFWLGISLGLAPISAWIALAPPRAALMILPVALLGAAVVCWVAGFDILYALQDEILDRDQGLHSVPAKLGRRGALWLSRACHAGTLAALTAVGMTFDFSTLYWVGVAVAAALLIVEQSLVTERDISRINLAFMTANGLLGAVFGALAILDLVVR